MDELGREGAADVRTWAVNPQMGEPRGNEHHFATHCDGRAKG
jgi:hypothetical protein